jgi:hypothetical protein
VALAVGRLDALRREPLDGILRDVDQLRDVLIEGVVVVGV